MVCRYYRIGSAATSYARITNGLMDRQCLSLYHDLQREGADHPAPTTEQQNALIDTLQSEIRNDNRISEARRTSLLRRLDEARNQNMSGPIYYATLSINERAAQARQTLNAYFDGAARDLGMSTDQVAGMFRAQTDAAIRAGRDFRADPTFARAFEASNQNTFLPMDRAGMLGFEHIEGLRRLRRAAAATRPTVTREPVNSTAITSIGYDPTTGRVEIEATGRPGIPYAYRMTQSEYDQFRQASSLGSYYNRNVRGNPRYQYRTADEHNAAATATQCGTCGQFVSPSEPHSCPVRDSQEERNRTQRVARAAMLGREATLTPPSQRFAETAANRTYTQSLEGNLVLPTCTVCSAPATRRVPMNGNRHGGYVYMCDTNHHASSVADAIAASSGGAPPTVNLRPDFSTPLGVNDIGVNRNGINGQVTLRTVPLSDVVAAARQHPGDTISIPINSNVLTSSLDAHDLELSRGHVTGRATVTYLGRARNEGYQVAAVTEPGDSGEDHLRCTCADYRARYDCVHVRETIANLSNRLNSRSPNRPEDVAEARRVVAEQVALEGYASREAQAVAIQEAANREPTVMLSEDPETFQRWYSEAKTEWEQNGIVPGEYLYENVFDGDDETTFGVELEWDAAPGRDRAEVARNISRRLHEVGLISDPSQQPYHAALNRGYTTQIQGGYSHERDNSVDGEVITCILTDKEEGWRSLRTACEIIRSEGGVATTRTGSHIHIGTKEYDHTIGNYNRLGLLIDEHADVIKRLSTNPERGRHRSGEGNTHTTYSPFPAEGYVDFDTLTSEYSGRHAGHDVAFNFASADGSNGARVEARFFDGTLDEKVIQAQAILMRGLKHKAFSDPDYRPGEFKPPGTHARHSSENRGPGRRLTGEAWLEQTKQFRELVDKICVSNESKRALVNLYAITKNPRH